MKRIKRENIRTINMLLLGSHHFFRGGFAHRLRQPLASETVLCGGYPVRYALTRHCDAV